MSVPYLKKSPKGHYSYRRVVPPALRDALGGIREIKKSLETTDFTTAVKRREAVHREAERALKAAATASPPSERELVLRDLKKVGLSKREIELIAQARGWELEGLEGLFFQLADEYEAAEAKGINPQVSLAAIKAIGEAKLPPIVHTLSSALDHYLDFKRLDIPAKDNALRNRVRHLKERLEKVLGKDGVFKRPVEAFTKAEAKELRDYLLQQEALSPNSVRRTLEIASAAINRMINEHDLQMRNPLLGLEIKGAGHNKDQRHPLTDAEMEALATIMVRGPEDALGAIWVTLRDTGARIGEVCNLRGMDLYRDREAMDIREYGDHTLKTKNSQRVVPLSPEALERLSRFLPTNPEAPLFPRYAGPRKAEKASAALMKRLRTVVTDEKKVVHSLRHRMKDRLRHTNCPESLSQEIMGHCPQNTANNYGLGNALRMMQEALVRVWEDPSVSTA